jgi:hypothetical protein
MKKIILPAILVSAVLALTGCSSSTNLTPEHPTFAQSVKIMDSQLASFQKELPKGSVLGAVKVGSANNKDGMAMGCDAGKLQTDGSTIFIKPSINREASITKFENQLKADGWTVSFYKQSATQKKLVADKDGWEYWFSTFDKTPSKLVTGSSSGIQIYGFGPCTTN